ncbi:nucleoid disruption protein [Acinetobacter phage AB-Navy97]|uniref:Nucleoid disruption protein n=10 Tax=Lazarusvirus TaxID=2842820 RepID=A0A4Y1NLN4_9CAUD|nr:Ndd-like nucleoid disruption protein [Acinetobacter phage vB_ApiM_fHyAci03]YP_009881452.1 Ndd-like nucleoid disruption protein [Acinetobacter phage KARL-1]YP_009886275.1 Ndd-like nucleoid disruption protein [Acinetobacter phage vB_AbaM_Berthold]YP_009886519.1 Ndd-like nucleoid disruption protein [Acinetobacter phage vB_AbaM_Apostate]YP_009886771.1 Ndd-like nucleoid disruption protein [Acinetobacter phage vB_AbaM_Kimel]YP_009887018.1 Ndd-like nucleoid disruption protein [Acinetobacter phage 
MNKSLMMLKDLRLVKSQFIARLTAKGALYEPHTTEPPVSDLTKPGFYFLVHTSRQEVYARFYVGRQRTGSGLRNIVSQIRLRRTKTGEMIMGSFSSFDIHYVSLDKMKAITNGYGKGKLALALTRQHADSFQNLEEMNRMLNDNFKFRAQKY